jgi:hypothetical protein
MAAIPLNLTIEQGVDYDVTFTVRNRNKTPLNLLGYSAESSIRKHYSSSTSYPFTITFVDRANGKLTLSMTDTLTSTLTEGRYVYDVVIINDSTGIKKRVVMGSVLVSPGVSY